MIEAVRPGSPADKAGIRPGETLEAINGHAIRDVLDYRFYAYEPRLTLTLLGRDGHRRTVKCRHAEGEDLGLDFPTYLMDSHKHCQNKCVFCFIDQMPKGCRSSLYVKDDDARLSFLLGNYITLTNLSEEDLSRITDMRISPLHISVHTTNGPLRAKMMGNPGAERCLELLQRFAEARLILHTQIVLCPGWNDGPELKRTLDDLQALGHCVESTSIVPVGLTAHREGLTALRPVLPEDARAAIELTGAYQRVYCADELYLSAGLPLPEPDFYDGYPQFENGVGLLTLLGEQWADADKPSMAAPQTLITGTAAAPFLKTLLHDFPIRVVAVPNDFFGSSVTVAGLVTGRDIAQNLKGKDLGSQVLIPSIMLRHDSRMFLDGMTVDELESALGVPVRVVEPDGEALAHALV